MKKLAFAALFTIVLGSAQANTIPAEELLLLTNIDGEPRFVLNYSAQESIAFGAAIWSGRQLLRGRAFYSLKLAYVDQLTGQRLSPWFDYEGRSATYDQQMGTNLLVINEVADRVTPKIRQLRLVFSLDQPADIRGEYPITHYIDIGRLCYSSPSLFFSVDQEVEGCPGLTR